MTAMDDTKALENYFSTLQSVLEEHDLLDKPAQLYNVYESEITLDHRPPHILVERGQKEVHFVLLVARTR